MRHAAIVAAMFGLAASALSAGCMMDGTAAAQHRVCDGCTPENMSGSGFALPRRGVVIYQGTVKIFDLDRRVFSFIETEPPLMRPRAATIVARRDVPLAGADHDWAMRMTDAAWAPRPVANAQRGCATTDGRLPAMVVLVNQATFFADYECGPADMGGQLSELTARADRIVQQRFGDITPK